MGVHQTRQSKSRIRRRRATQKLAAPNLVECPQCHQLKQQHHACLACGTYKGSTVIETDSD
ncbi:MAG: 50S ribosomal protein L32 [Gracilibacteraceae bacterium]|nr:50S ribosomal protein L32 [Gracilibacteraceae bacterium]